MKKAFLVLSVLLVFGFLVGCSNGSTDNTGGDPDLVGRWQYDSNTNWNIVFNADGTGKREVVAGEDIGKNTTNFTYTANNGALTFVVINTFSGQYSVSGNTLTLSELSISGVNGIYTKL